MLYFVAAIAGLLVGAGVMWYVKVRPIKDAVPPVIEDDGKLKTALELIAGVHALGFTPYGMAPAALTNACNKMWKFAGLAEKGIPKP